jgi:hypothetical protein
MYSGFHRSCCSIIIFLCSVFLSFLLSHCIVYPSSINGFWLPLWYLSTFSIIQIFHYNKYSMWLWSICKNIFPRYLELHGCVILLSAGSVFFCPFYLATVLSVLLQLTASDYPFGIFQLFQLYKYSMWLWSIYRNIFPRYLEFRRQR